MPNVIVSVEYGRGDCKDLALPLDVPCRSLAVALAEAFKLENSMEEVFTLIETDVAGGRQLPQNATLADVGILHGRVLKLASEHLKEARAIPQGGAWLQTEVGRKLVLNGAYTLIGRRDPKHNILPDLDLSSLDDGKVTSRRHACIEFDQKSYVVTDLKSANGTWINGERLQAESKKALREGDEIVFGRNGVKVIFKRG